MPMTLGYWKIRGLAHQIRLLLTYCGEDFKDELYEQGDGPEFSRAEWLNVKFTLGLDFPNLPYLIDGKVNITETSAIMRYIARKYDLCGNTESEQTTVDMMQGVIEDFREGWVRLCFNPDFMSMRANYAESIFGKLKPFSEFLGQKPWLTGRNLTFVDFSMYEVLAIHIMLVPNCLDRFPNLKAFVDRFEDLSQIKDYFESSKFTKLPQNNKYASWGTSVVD